MNLSVNVEAEFLAAILQGHSLDSDLLSKVDFGYFSVDSYKWLVKQLKARKWQPIAYDYLDQILIDNVKEAEKQTLYRQQIYALYQKEITFLKDAEIKFKAFTAYSCIKSAIKDSFEAHEKSGRTDYLVKDIMEATREAHSLIHEDGLKVIDYAEDYDSRMSKRVSERDNPDLSPVVLTGIKGLDDQFKIKPGMIVDFLAPFKRYKSIILNNMGFSSLLQGFNVVHVIYENTIALTTDRYDSLFSELSFDRLVGMYLSPEEKKSLDSQMHWIGKWDARLKVIKCTANKTNLEQVAEKIEKLQVTDNFVPNVIVLDYLNLVAPVLHSIKEERLRQAAAAWDAKALIDHFNVPMFTATQAKMEANKVDRMDSTHRGKAIDISQAVNLSIALDQTKEERAEGRLVLSPHIYREGKIVNSEIVVNTALERMAISRSYKPLWDRAFERYGYLTN